MGHYVVFLLYKFCVFVFLTRCAHNIAMTYFKALLPMPKRRQKMTKVAMKKMMTTKMKTKMNLIRKCLIISCSYAENPNQPLMKACRRKLFAPIWIKIMSTKVNDIRTYSHGKLFHKTVLLCPVHMDTDNKSN